MLTFVILAAGRGSRMRDDEIHKALLPLNGKAIISHQLDLVPENSRIIVCLGHKGDQIRSYLRHAHPEWNIKFIDVKDWDQPGNGPGATLLKVRESMPFQGEDLAFTTCDTLWESLPNRIWQRNASWVGVADIPPGTPNERWCRMSLGEGGPMYDNMVLDVLDKTPEETYRPVAWTGLAKVVSRDLNTFWDGLRNSKPRDGELQISGGLDMLARSYSLRAYRINWLDTGDADAYAKAVNAIDGYDYSKKGEATYILPEEGRVVKYNADHTVATARARRAEKLGKGVPQPVKAYNHFTVYPYTPGVNGYEYAEDHGPKTMNMVLDWFETFVLPTEKKYTADDAISRLSDQATAHWFYHEKTIKRIQKLNSEYQEQAREAVCKVDFDSLARGTRPGHFHGDLTYSNVIITPGKYVERVIGIDWRPEFVSRHLGDIRYDLGKLLSGTYVHWHNAQHGDFKLWSDGVFHRLLLWPFIRRHGFNSIDIHIIAGLCLINSAPLHAPPFDRILVERGSEMLNSLTKEMS